MQCPKCQQKMKPDGTVDETWRFYKCKCGYMAARHIKVSPQQKAGESMKKIVKYRRLKRGWASCFVCETPDSPNGILIDGKFRNSEEFWFCDNHLKEFQEQAARLCPSTK